MIITLNKYGTNDTNGELKC